MNDHLAIAVVTTTIRHVLAAALDAPHAAPVSGATVTASTLGGMPRAAADGQPGLNVLLYRVGLHPADGEGLPVRNPTERFPSAPGVTLDLDYLVTAHGDDRALEAQRLLARGILAIAASPVLTSQTIAETVARYGDLPGMAFLADASTIDPVPVRPLPLAVEELARLWPADPPATSALAAAYRATVTVRAA